MKERKIHRIGKLSICWPQADDVWHWDAGLCWNGKTLFYIRMHRWHLRIIEFGSFAYSCNATCLGDQYGRF
jgi:hypothetical protein